jgi:hypothetical protein
VRRAAGVDAVSDQLVQLIREQVGITGPLLAFGVEQLSEETVDLLLNLAQALSTSMPSKRLPDQGKADPNVCLASGHGTLGQEHEVATLSRLIVEELKKLNAMACDAIPKGS